MMRISLFLLLLCLSAVGCTCNAVPASVLSPASSSPPPSSPSSSSSVSSSAQSQSHVLFVAIPLPGHLNPLLSQGFELHRRGWRVTVASANRMKNHVTNAIAKANVGERVTFMDLGNCAAISQLQDALERSAHHENYMESSREMFEWSVSLHHCMYSALHQQLSSIDAKNRPTLVVSDFATYAGFDIADALGIPFVVNNPDLLNMLAPAVLLPYDFVPGTMTANSINYTNSTDSYYALGQRVLYPILRIVLGYVAEATGGKVLAEFQEQLGLPITGVLNRMRGRLVLVNNAFGIEYARPLAPNVVMVGPMLSQQWKREVSVARQDFRQQLSADDESWLNFRQDGQSKSTPVIWVSMGTIAPLNQRQVLELYSAFSYGVRAGLFRVLWKLDPSDLEFLPPEADRPSKQNMKIVDWVSSQLGVLAHDATQIFISHCGINSVHESVYLGTKLFCIPILADQADMAARVEDAGVGHYLSKSTFNSSSLIEKITTLLDADNQVMYERSMRKARAAMQLSGGVERAVDYIEFVAAHGAEALIPVDSYHPWYVYYGLDVTAVYLLLLFIFYQFFHCICCRVRPGKECVEDRRKVRAIKEEEYNAAVSRLKGD